jgi:hypothetical protein
VVPARLTLSVGRGGYFAMNTLFEKPAFAAVLGFAGAVLMFLPSLMAHLRHARSFRSVAALNALGFLTLACSFASLWFLVATGTLWVFSTVLAAVSPRLGAQQDGST